MFHDIDKGGKYYVSNFSILDNMDKYISVFIEIDEQATIVLNKYIKLERKYSNADIISIRREIYNYIISVRENDLKNIMCDKIYDNLVP